jgi:hypothetical protein
MSSISDKRKIELLQQQYKVKSLIETILEQAEYKHAEPSFDTAFQSVIIQSGGISYAYSPCNDIHDLVPLGEVVPKSAQFAQKETKTT